MAFSHTARLDPFSSSAPTRLEPNAFVSGQAHLGNEGFRDAGRTSRRVGFLVKGRRERTTQHGLRLTSSQRTIGKGTPPQPLTLHTRQTCTVLHTSDYL